MPSLGFFVCLFLFLKAKIGVYLNAESRAEQGGREAKSKVQGLCRDFHLFKPNWRLNARY
jgi:hypothetical protein